MGYGIRTVKSAYTDVLSTKINIFSDNLLLYADN